MKGQSAQNCIQAKLIKAAILMALSKTLTECST